MYIYLHLLILYITYSMEMFNPAPLFALYFIRLWIHLLGFI